MQPKADFQSVEFSEQTEILLFERETLRLSNLLLAEIPPAWKIPLTGN